MNWAKRATKAGTDQLVGLASGDIPIKALDERQTATRIVVAIAIIALGGSGWLLWWTIDTRAKLPPLPNTNTKEQVAKLTALKNKDTDGDGLNDYDELYTYSSSPYLYSTAGDNVSDGEKVKAGTNPNCAIGTTCSVPTSNGSTSTNSSTDDTVSVEFLREALIAAGASATTVNAADDATIIRLYQQATKDNAAAITSGNTNTASNTNASTNTNSPTMSSLENMTPAQIRALLVQNGISATTLGSVDDTTLKAIFQQAINTNS